MVRYSWMIYALFESIAQVQEFAARWPWYYKYEWPDMALGSITLKKKLALVA